MKRLLTLSLTVSALAFAPVAFAAPSTAIDQPTAAMDASVNKDAPAAGETTTTTKHHHHKHSGTHHAKASEETKTKHHSHKHGAKTDSKTSEAPAAEKTSN